MESRRPRDRDPSRPDLKDHAAVLEEPSGPLRSLFGGRGHERQSGVREKEEKVPGAFSLKLEKKVYGQS